MILFWHAIGRICRMTVGPVGAFGPTKNYADIKTPTSPRASHVVLLAWQSTVSPHTTTSPLTKNSYTENNVLKFHLAWACVEAFIFWIIMWLVLFPPSRDLACVACATQTLRQLTSSKVGDDDEGDSLYRQGLYRQYNIYYLWMTRQDWSDGGSTNMVSTLYILDSNAKNQKLFMMCPKGTSWERWMIDLSHIFFRPLITIYGTLLIVFLSFLSLTRWHTHNSEFFLPNHRTNHGNIPLHFFFLPPLL